MSPCIPIALPYIYTPNQAVGRARHAKRGIEFTNSVRSALDWMLHFTTDLNTKNKSWHGDQLIPTKQRDVEIDVGDAGSEWGLGGFDGQHYFYTKWPDHMWSAIQRKKLERSQAARCTWRHSKCSSPPARSPTRGVEAQL